MYDDDHYQINLTFNHKIYSVLTFDGWMPFNCTDHFVLREAKVSKRLVFLEVGVRFAPNNTFCARQKHVVILEQVHHNILLQKQVQSANVCI